MKTRWQIGALILGVGMFQTQNALGGPFQYCIGHEIVETVPGFNCEQASYPCSDTDCKTHAKDDYDCGFGGEGCYIKTDAGVGIERVYHCKSNPVSVCICPYQTDQPISTSTYSNIEEWCATQPW